MKHWIVIPVFDEAASLGKVVRAARRHGPVLVVDDGSRDESAAVARQAGAEVLRHARRRGKGKALRSGADLAIARGASHILTMDGDGQHDAREIPALLAAAHAAPRAIIVGARLRAPDAIPAGRRAAQAVAGFALNWLAGTAIRDTQSGFRIYPAGLFREVPLRRGGFVLESEALLEGRRAGYEIREVAVTAIYPPGRRSRFHPLADGCAVGAFLARRAVTRWGAEACRRLALPREPRALRRALPGPPGWRGRRRARELRVVAVAFAAAPALAFLGLLQPILRRLSLDPMTPLVRRCYSLDRLSRAREEDRGIDARRAEGARAVPAGEPGR